MKRLIAVTLIALSLLTTSAFAEGNPNNDWVWLNGYWVYTGTDPVPPPPPPLKL